MVARRTAAIQGGLEDVAGHRELVLDFHADDLGEELDECVGRMAAHDDVMEMLRHRCQAPMTVIGDERCVH